jgi:hypothetical protein
MTLAHKLSGLVDVLKGDAPAKEKLFLLARSGSKSLHLAPALSVERCVVVEAQQPPKMTRGLSDLVIRRAEEADIPAVAALDSRPPALFRKRLARGDFVYLGQLDGKTVCHTCYHQGPTPFEEERRTLALWALEDASTFWSYDAWAPVELRTAGVVAKLFVKSLNELFNAHGARRVRGFIHDWNKPSRILHERMGFTTLGTVTAVGLAGMKWVRWESGGHARRWVVPRNSDFALPPAMN